MSAEDFHTLNRCLDQAIADAATEYARRRDQRIAEDSERGSAERLGLLAHEMRNVLNTAVLPLSLIRRGGVAADGAESAVVDRSHAQLHDLIERALADVRLSTGMSRDLSRKECTRVVTLSAGGR